MRVLVYLQLLCFIIHHPLDTISISHRPIVGSPEHISKWHSYHSTLSECTKESISFRSSIWMKGNMNIISRMNSKPHRCRSICPHQHMTTENRKCNVHDEISVLIAQCWHTLSGRHLTKTMNISNKLSTKYRLVESKCFFCVI